MGRPLGKPDGGPATHPFLRGNFAPVTDEYISEPCTIDGEIPAELLGGQYVRNGGNPVYPPEKGRHYHWFDGDGMLHGVLFPTSPDQPPLYTNRHLATPLLTLTLLLLRSPIPSIALLISPLSSLHRIVAAIMQAFFLLLRARMGVLSVANTSVVWWGKGLGKEAAAEQERERERQRGDKEKENGQSPTRPPLGRRRTTNRLSSRHVPRYEPDQRLLATCESGPPLEVRVPELETIGWDRLPDRDGEHLGMRRGRWEWFKRFGLARVQEDWMTAHPRVDPIDGSLLFYSTQMFDAPHARYSVIDRHGTHLVWKHGIELGRAKMMHDFAATRTHTILLNLPLTLAPANLFSIPPVPLIHFDRHLPSEFVIFPRLFGASADNDARNDPQTTCNDNAHHDEPIRFTDPEPSLIFHTANAWDETDSQNRVTAVHMLGCRFRSAKLVYAAGAVEVPIPEAIVGADDVVRLWYYRFALPAPTFSSSSSQDPSKGVITHQFPLTAIPFEFPSTHPDLGMQEARYVYGCTMRSGSFDERLGGAAKVDCLVKIDVLALAERGRAMGEGKRNVPVDQRESGEFLAQQEQAVADGQVQGLGHDEGSGRGEVQIFALPEGWYAQEPRFVPRANAVSEDDGYLLTYVYDESNLLPDGTPSSASGSGSELWIVDALRMTQGQAAVVCRIKLPQRVPYGLHGTYLPPTQIAAQRTLPSPLPTQPRLQDKLHRSRIQHFVSLLFDRPSARDMSRIERWVLAVLWPAAVGALCLAAVDMLGDLKWRDDWRHGSLLAGAYDGIGHGRDGDGGTGSGLGSGSVSELGMSRAAGEVLIEASTGVGRWGPQVVGLLAALLTSLIRSGVIRLRWPGTGATLRSSETSGEAEGTVTPDTHELESCLNSEDEAEEAL